MILQVIFLLNTGEVFKYSYFSSLPYCHELVAHVYYNKSVSLIPYQLDF